MSDSNDRVSRRKVLAATCAGAALALANSRQTVAQGAGLGKTHPLLATSHEGIRRARDAAIAILKPTNAQLEHGLELHRNSLVFDGYGFAPRAAIDGAKLAALDAEGASEAEIQDAREEMTMTRPAQDLQEGAEFHEAMTCSGVTAIFQNAGEEGQDPLMLLKRLSRFTYLGDHLTGTLVRAARPDDILAAKEAGKHCLYLTGNGVPLPQQWVSVEQELGYVRLFYQLGIRMMHVTYNRRNMLGDGCAETANGGLSDFGRAAIAEMNRVGVIVDVAHSGWQTSLEAATVSGKPMVASHTSCDGIKHHVRAKPDAVLKQIAATGGLAGICCIPQFLGGDGDVVALLDHIAYAVKLIGVDHVSIGTDVSHTSQYTSAESQKGPKRPKSRTRFAALWPEGALGGSYPKSNSLAWTNWPLFTVGLVQRGYSDAEIQKIIGGNVMRVCRAVLK